MNKPLRLCIGLLLLVTLSCNLPGRSRVKVTNHDAPPLTLSSEPFQQAGCVADEYGRWTCPAESPLADLGCTRFTAAPALLGGLSPSLPIALCQILPLEEGTGILLPEGEYLYQDGCMMPIFVRYVVDTDGAFQVIKNLSELQAFYAPIDSSDEALSYALASTGLDAVYGLEYQASFRYFTKSLEDTHVVANDRVYEVYLYRYQFCGCGPHTTSLVQVDVGKDGSIQKIQTIPAFEDPKQDGLCVD